MWVGAQASRSKGLLTAHFQISEERTLYSWCLNLRKGGRTQQVYR